MREARREDFDVSKVELLESRHVHGRNSACMWLTLNLTM
jgi:hypothetical protein